MFGSQIEFLKMELIPEPLYVMKWVLSLDISNLGGMLEDFFQWLIFTLNKRYYSLHNGIKFL